jgi:hypothetical protein
VAAKARDGVVASKFGKMFMNLHCALFVHRFILSTEYALLRLCLSSSLNQIRKCYSEKLTTSETHYLGRFYVRAGQAR